MNGLSPQIEKHLELGGEDDAAEILITFLFRYGSIPDTSRSGLDNKLRSPLKEDTIVTTQGKGPEKGFAEMGSVFQIDNCIRVFQACYFILRRKLQKPSTDPSHSILGYIIDAQWLREERKDCQRLIPASTSHADRRVISTASPNFPPGLPFNWRENACARSVQSAHQKNGMKKQRHGTNETAEKQLANGGKRNTGRVNDRLKSHGTEILIDTDDEAEQLKVGYGMSTPSGISYPSKTTPKNSKRAREKNKKTPKANKGGKRFSI